MSRMNEKIKGMVVLCAICLTVAVLLSGINFVTAPIIEAAESNAVTGALAEVYPGLKNATKLDLTTYEGLPETVAEAYSVTEDGGTGYVVKLVTTGYASDFVILCGISPNGTVLGAKCLSSKETNGAEKTYGEALTDKTMDDIDAVDTVAGSTKTTTAYKNAVKDALGAALVLGGGSYDSRTEEEIKRDEALPAANGEFEAVFYAEYVEGLTLLYKATNGAGYVFVFGEDYVGVDASGTVVSDAESSYAESAPDALAAILATTRVTLDALEYSDVTISSKVKILSVEKTASGNYVLTLTTNGYNVTGEHSYAPVKTPIKLSVSISASGVIICTKTLDQAETEGIGDACADPDFYNQYNGKDSSSYEGVDAISGATVTSNAYKLAIKTALEIVSALESSADGQ